MIKAFKAVDCPVNMALVTFNNFYVCISLSQEETEVIVCIVMYMQSILE